MPASILPTLLALFAPGPTEMLVVGLLVLLLFGTRLPSVMRSLGVGITEFRKGIRGEVDEDGNAAIERQDSKSRDDASPSKQTTSNNV